MDKWGALQDLILRSAEIALICYGLILWGAWQLKLVEQSVLFSLAVWCINDAATTLGTPHLFALVSAGSLAYAGWYVTFVFANSLAIFAIVYWHTSRKIEYRKLSVSIIGILLLICFFHMLRLLEWMYLNLIHSEATRLYIFTAFTQSFGADFYRFGLMSLKYLAVFIFVLSLVSDKRSLA